MSGQLQSQEDLFKVLETLPCDDIVHAFGYGSGVFHQKHNDNKSDTSSIVDVPLVDLIIVVDNARQFHEANVAMNPRHYPFRNAGVCAALQTYTLPANPWLRNPGVFFLVTDTFKYGVVEHKDFRDDLQHWKYLYLAGRLHKPTVTILQDDEIQHTFHESCNLPAALAAGLLLINDPTCFSITHLFETIASLSYNGDPRVQLGGEDPHKISKLVNSCTSSLQRWKALYEPSIQHLEQRGILQRGDDNIWSWDAQNPLARQTVRQQLPTSLAHRGEEGLSHVLPKIVAPAARYQTMKGLLSVGPSRSIGYAYRKLTKGVLRHLV